MMDLFVNDNYKLLKLMYDNQTVILNKRVVPLTQMEISSALNFSKMKTNAIFVELQNTGLIIQETRGKYSLTDIANEIIEGVCKLDKLKFIYGVSKSHFHAGSTEIGIPSHSIDASSLFVIIRHFASGIKL